MPQAAMPVKRIAPKPASAVFESVPTSPTYGTVTLAWDYPAKELTTNISFNLRSGTLDVPMTNWQVITNVRVQQVTLSVQPGLHLFVATATNTESGLESDFSNTVYRKPIPTGNQTIRQ
jgi:hypothetical protein